jgi:hypothetical protein
MSVRPLRTDATLEKIARNYLGYARHSILSGEFNTCVRPVPKVLVITMKDSVYKSSRGDDKPSRAILYPSVPLQTWDLRRVRWIGDKSFNAYGA